MTSMKPSECPDIKVGAMPSAPATHEPSGSVSALRVSVRIARGGVGIRPMFTSRVHRAPVAKGHRSFILAKQEWR